MRKIITIIILIILVILCGSKEYVFPENITPLQTENKIQNISIEEAKEKEIDDWRLILVNIDNPLPEGFEPELASIDKTRKFDARAIDYLLQMLADMKSAGYKNIWPQSTYRSVERQQEIFDKKVSYYMNLGKNRKEAEKLTLQKINKPGTSEHNLGLAVDFNNVDYKFESTKEYKWLVENAENYGFILRYARDKTQITKVDCEPWHWRYVGEENAKKMNELNMCLEEYISYLKKN